EDDGIQPLLPLQVALGQGRALIRRMLLVGDDRHVAVEALLTQRLRSGRSGQPAADDDQMGHDLLPSSRILRRSPSSVASAPRKAVVSVIVSAARTPRIDM